MTPSPWLFASALGALGACKSEEADTGTASATDITGTGSPADTGSTTDAPTGPDEHDPGSVTFFDGAVTLADGGFTLELNEFNEDPLSFTCTLSDQNFSCADLEVELWTQGDPDARAAMMMSIAGAWTSDTELSFTITGALACTGDENACNHMRPSGRSSCPAK